ncbi:uncharacterized protein LOC143451618 isoform X2 [Clavelina lepadiformis]|uniref:uncharacterized protein LOC143451618 isoform X2 n=1 Tax=Clavelina lepadiformis TaxID=159417 RepID=UPI004041A025
MPLTVTSPSESYLKCEEENITETSNGNTAGDKEERNASTSVQMPSEDLGVLTPPKEEVLSRSTEDCTLDSSTSTQETELADCPQSQVEGCENPSISAESKLCEKLETTLDVANAFPQSSSLKTLAGIFSDDLNEQDGGVISVQRQWSAPVDINFVNETCAIIGSKGGTIEVGDCKIIIPEGALQHSFELKFVLLFGKEHFTVPRQQVVTPSLRCVPPTEFMKPITIQLPTCYSADRTVSVTPQKSKDGRTWEDLKVVEHKNSSSIITFETSSLSWQRVVGRCPDAIDLSIKRLFYLCYRQPASRDNDPIFTWEIRDNVMVDLPFLDEVDGIYFGVARISSKDNLHIRLSGQDTTFDPDEWIITFEDVYEQGSFLQQHFRVSKTSFSKTKEHVNHEKETYKYEVQSSLSDDPFIEGHFPLLRKLDPEMLPKVTLSHNMIPALPTFDDEDFGIREQKPGFIARCRSVLRKPS